MTALCIDTNAYSAYRRSKAEILTVISAASHLWVPAVVLGELRFGFVNGNQNVRHELELGRFLASPSVSVAPIDAAASREYALLSQQLRLAGVPIPTNDIWIAAAAKELCCPLLTLDAHFRCVEGLAVVQGMADWILLHN